MDILINEMLLLSHFVDVHTYIKNRKLSRLFANVCFEQEKKNLFHSFKKKKMSKSGGRPNEEKLKVEY